MRPAIMCLILMLLLGTPAVSTPRDKAVEPTNWGRVLGQVYDAKTGEPLRGAAVVVRQDGQFAASGRTTGVTDPMGRYRCDAMLGRVSSNLDIGRLLNSGWIGLLVGGATNRTKRIDVTRLTVRITRDGYNPFEGVVQCRSVDPKRFAVTLSPILLTPAGSPEAPTAADGWGAVRLTDVKVEPAVLHAGEQAQVIATVRSPALLSERDLKVSCQSPLWGHRGLEPQKQQDGVVEYRGRFTAPKSKKLRIEKLVARIDSSPYDVSSGAASRTTLVQVVTTPSEEEAARTRQEAYALEQSGDNAGASVKLKELASRRDADIWDMEQLADVSLTLHDDPAAADALQRAVANTPEKARIGLMGRYASALIASGRGSQVLSELVPVVQRIKEAERPEKVPVPLMVAIGNAYLQAGRLDDATDTSVALLKWEDSGLYPEVAKFQNALRMAKAETKAKEEPDSAPARADYGRALMDEGRWEEAVTELGAAVKLDPATPALQRDLAYAAMHLRPSESVAAEPNLDESIGAAESQVEIHNGKKVSKSKDFFAWHSLGMLLYKKAVRQQAAGDAGAAQTLEQSRAALLEALKCGRTGADVSGGMYLPFVGYATPSVVAISGFAYREANSDFVILESLKALERDPKDYMALYNLGAGLLELGHADLAAEPIRRAQELKPDLLDATYARALIALRNGDRDVAIGLLRDVLRQNPRHPHANLVLARIYTEDGNVPAAAACLAAHAALYGAGSTGATQSADDDSPRPFPRAQAASDDAPWDQ